MSNATLPRKAKCLGCGFTLELTSTYYLWRKEWNKNHFPYHTANYSKELNQKLLAEHNVKI